MTVIVDDQYTLLVETGRSISSRTTDPTTESRVSCKIPRLLVSRLGSVVLLTKFLLFYQEQNSVQNLLMNKSLSICFVFNDGPSHCNKIVFTFMNRDRNLDSPSVLHQRVIPLVFFPPFLSFFEK